MALPLELRAGLGLAAVAVALFAWHRVAEGLREEGRRECEAAYATSEREARAEVGRLAAKDRQRQQENLNAYDANLEREKRFAADTRRELDRVRLAAAIAAGGGAAAAIPGASAPADAAGDDRRLLAEGAELVAEGRDRLGELAAQVTALQGEIRACAAQPESGPSNR